MQRLVPNARAGGHLAVKWHGCRQIGAGVVDLLPSWGVWYNASISAILGVPKTATVGYNADRSRFQATVGGG